MADDERVEKSGTPSPEALAFAQDWAQPSRRMQMARALDEFAREAVERERARIRDSGER